MTDTGLAHIRDRELQERVLQEGLLDTQSLQAVFSQQHQRYQQSQAALAGPLYQVHLALHQLQIKQSVDLTPINTLPLVTQQRQEIEWQFWGRQLLILNPADPQQVDAYKWRPGAAIGLSLSADGPYIHLPDLADQPQLMHSNSLLDPRSASSGLRHGPYDLFIAHDGQLICVSDRAAGDVHLIDPDSYRVKDIFTLRDKASQKALLIAPDPTRQRLFFVDQQQARIGILDYAEGIQEDLLLEGLKPVQLAFDGQFLYALIAEPDPCVIKWDAESLNELARQTLPQALYSQHQGCAANPFVLSPDGQQLVVLLGKNPDTVLCWLQADTLAISASHDLAGKPLPVMLSFARPNPLQQHRKHLAELLLAQGVLTRETLLNWFPPPDTSQEDFDTELEIIGPETVIVPEELPQPVPLPQSVSQRQQDAALLFLSPIERLSSLPEARKADNLPLPESAEADIVMILSGAFYQQTQIDLNSHPEALALLRQKAREYRIALQDHDVLPVEINDLVDGQRLRTLLLRDSILTLLELRGTPERYPYDTPPTHCPACRSPLLGRWDCESCGLELLSPERARARRVASATSRTWLPPGIFAITDVQSGRLLLVNTQRHEYVTWQIDFRYLPGAKQPWDSLWLEDMHILLTDRGANRVLECDQAGRIHWELDTEAHPELRLMQPVKSTCRTEGGERHYLIVDQGHHRILEVDAENKLHWHYGIRGEAGSDVHHLHLPSDVHYTHENTYLIADTGNNRVLEVSGKNVVRTWGLQHKLSRPVWAQRLFNGHTLIVDAGNYRLLEFDRQDELFRETVYFKEGMDERFDISHPLKVMRRENQNIVLIDSNRLMEVDPLSKQIVWFSFLHDLRLQLHLPDRLQQPTIKVPGQNEAYENFEPVNAEEMPTLRRSLQKVPLFKEASPAFFQSLERKLRFRSYSAGEVILRKGQSWHSFFIVQSGQVVAISGQEDSQRMLLGAGDHFGLMGIIYPEPRSSAIHCEQDCGLYVLDKRDFDGLLQNYPQIAAEVQKLAGERLLMARLRQTPKSQQAAERLQSLMQTHRERAQQRLKKVTGSLKAPGQKAAPRQLSYSETEQKVMLAARSEGLSCLELHILLKVNTRMKAARVTLIAAVLDRLGTIIRSDPSAEELQEERFGQQVVFTVLTAQPQAQIAEDVCALSDVLKVDVLPVELQPA